MDKNHRQTTFSNFVRKFVQSLKTIEEEKLLLLSFKEFNLNDAFRVLSSGKQDYPLSPKPTLNSQISLSEVELGAALLSLPGQMMAADPGGVSFFVRKYGTGGSIKFEDFERAFRPVDKAKAKQLV